jgi:HD superfamily phosphodiesterase
MKKVVNQNKLIKELKELAKKTLDSNERFHDYGHAISVFNNAKKIIDGEKAHKRVNVLVVLTACLFHDISSEEKNDSLESAKLIPELLASVKDFPEDLVKDVQRLVVSIEKGMMSENNLDEIIINEADSLEALSKLSICRAFMIYGKRSLKVKFAIEDFRNYINKKYKELNGENHTKTAQKICNKKIMLIEKFLDDCLTVYKD